MKEPTGRPTKIIHTSGGNNNNNRLESRWEFDVDGCFSFLIATSRRIKYWWTIFT